MSLRLAPPSDTDAAQRPRLAWKYTDPSPLPRLPLLRAIALASALRLCCRLSPARSRTIRPFLGCAPTSLGAVARLVGTRNKDSSAGTAREDTPPFSEVQQ